MNKKKPFQHCYNLSLPAGIMLNILIIMTFIISLYPSIALSIDISDGPMESQVQPVPPNLMIIFDNSRSMDWEIMVDEDKAFSENGRYTCTGIAPNSLAYIWNLTSHIDSGWISNISDNSLYHVYWMVRCHGINRLYYNPTIKYDPWPGMPNADITAPFTDPMSTETGAEQLNLKTTFASYKTYGSLGGCCNCYTHKDQESHDIPRAHYFTYLDLNPTNGSYDPGQERVFLVTWKDTDNDGTLDTRVYYENTDTCCGTLCSWENLSNVAGTADLQRINAENFPDELRYEITDENGNPSGTYLTDAEDLQNFANWFTYYRRKSYLAKAAIAKTIQSLSEDVNIGFYPLHQGTYDSTTQTYAYPKTCAGIVQAMPNIVVVDNNDNDGSFSYSGSWASWWSGNPRNGSARYNAEIICWSQRKAKFVPTIPTTSTYRIFAYWPTASNHDRSARYEVKHTSGSSTYTINQHENAGTWVEIGDGSGFNFNAGKSETIGSVLVYRDNCGSKAFKGTWADAIKFVENVQPDTRDEKDIILGNLFQLGNVDNGSKPLRTALDNVGKYLTEDTGDGSGGFDTTPSPGCPSPYSGTNYQCLSSFAIVVTDGYWNDSFTGAGNLDGDGYSNTLADVAQKYYSTDLTNSDEMQRLITYTISLGAKGTIDTEAYYNEGTQPGSWPNPESNDRHKIDDLFHAAVNGHGRFFNATDPQIIIDDMGLIMNKIEQEVKSVASLATNAYQLDKNSVRYQSSYVSSSWTGDVTAYHMDEETGDKLDQKKWSAAEKLTERLSVSDGWQTRKIITYNPELAIGQRGVPFTTDSGGISEAQKTLLGVNPTEKVNYLLGDNSNEGTGVGLEFRKRQYCKTTDNCTDNVLGDFVHSEPVLVGGGITDGAIVGTVYVGSNAGMLHAFNAETGEERFAYVPNLVYNNLAELTNPSYVHNYFIDKAPYATKVGDSNYLVGGLGKGGKGYYCLDITDADSITSSSSSTEVLTKVKVKWEFPATTDNDMGYSFSDAYIVRTYDSEHEWVVIFGNGYNSASGAAALYILDLKSTDFSTDTNYRKIVLDNSGSDNGLSSPAVVDVNFDGKADYVYAGDLKGNLWKFNLHNPDWENWDVAYYSGSTDNKRPLFQATYKYNDGASIITATQPITSRPAIMKHCVKEGYMVVFGTGKFLGENDRTDTSRQTLYGIWDYGDSPNEYLGAFCRDIDNEIPSTQTFSGSAEGDLASGVSLLRQTHELNCGRTCGNQYYTEEDAIGIISDETATWETLCDPDDTCCPNTSNPCKGNNNIEDNGIFEIDDFGEQIHPNPKTGSNVGWYFDFPFSGERSIHSFEIQDGRVIGVSFYPTNQSCSGGGFSVMNVMDACTGGRLAYASINLSSNFKKKVTEGDMVKTHIDGVETTVAPSRLKLKDIGIAPKPTFVRTSDGKNMAIIDNSIAPLSIVEERIGITYFYPR